MKSAVKAALQAASVLLTVISAGSLAIHADEAPARDKSAAQTEAVLDLSAASIPLTLEGAEDAGKEFVVGHTTDRGWFANVASGNPRSPDVEGQILVVGSGGGNQVYGYDVLSGERKWTASSKDSGISDIVIGLGRAYYTTYSCTIESVRVADGQQMYSKYLAPTVDCAPDVDETQVATAFSKGGNWQVSMRDAEKGEQKWNTRLEDSDVLSAPIIMDDGVYLTSANGNLTRLDGKKGRQDWKADYGAVSAPVPTRWGLLVATTWDGRNETTTAKVSEADRKKRERETVTESDDIEGTVIAAGNRRIALVDNVNARPEGKAGKQDAGPRATLDFQGLRPGVTEKCVILAYNGRVTAVDPVSGKAAWSIKLAESCNFARPVANRGLVFVASDTGLASAIEESTGALVWSYKFKNTSFAAAPAVDDGRLYLTTTGGLVVALPTGAGNVDAGAPADDSENAEGNAAAYWRVQETFRKVRNILARKFAVTPIAPEAPAATDGTPSGEKANTANAESNAIRPREEQRPGKGKK